MTSQLSLPFDSDLSTVPQLPVRVTPIHDETRSSWLARLCQANAVSAGTLSGWLQRKTLFQRDLDRGASSLALRVLEKLSGLSIQTLKSMSLLDNNQHFLEYDSVHGTVPYISSVSRTRRGNLSRGMSFCPDCLQDDPIPYFRKQWRFNFVTTCLKHRRLLIDHCPHCNEPFQHNFGSTISEYYNREEMMRCAYCSFPIHRNHCSSSDQKCAVLLHDVTSNLQQATEEHWAQFASSGQYIHCASWLKGIRLLLRFVFSGSIHHATLGKLFSDGASDCFSHEDFSALCRGSVDVVKGETMRQRSEFVMEHYPVKLRAYALALVRHWLISWPNSFREAALSSDESKKFWKIRELESRELPFWISETIPEALYRVRPGDRSVELDNCRRFLIARGYENPTLREVTNLHDKKQLPVESPAERLRLQKKKKLMFNRIPSSHLNKFEPKASWVTDN